MKRLLILLFAASSLTAVGQVPDYVPTDGLVAWYPLAENGEDASGNAHDLIQVGSPVWTLDESWPYCDFDGEGTHFYHPQALFPEVSELTISFWTRIDALSSGSNVGDIRPIISKHYSSADGSFILHPFEDGIQAWQFSAPHPIELGTWYHLTYVVSEVSKLYIDGELVNSADSPTNGWNPTDHPFMIGGWLNSPWWSNWSNTALTFDGGMSSVGLWSRELSHDEISQLLDPVSGCMHEQACNYNGFASTDAGTCDFVSCHCLTGTVWDEDLGGCIGDGSGDINLDGCVQLNDLLDLLSAYGDCGAEESPWQCGDPLEYQGYNYETVQIGEQCWFAENCRYLPSVGTTNYTGGTAVVYDYNGYDEDEAMSTDEYMTYGVLYKHSAVESWDLCPQGWHIPSDIDWMGLEASLGMADNELDQFGFRGTGVGYELKSSTQWNGNNESGFNALAAGYQSYYLYGSVFYGSTEGLGSDAYYWTTDVGSSSGTALYRHLNSASTQIGRGADNVGFNFSVRCIQNAE